MSPSIYPTDVQELSRKRRGLAPETDVAFQAFSRQVLANGALPATFRKIIAVAVAHVTQCPYRIKSPTKETLRHAYGERADRSNWIAAEMRAGGRLCQFGAGVQRND